MTDFEVSPPCLSMYLQQFRLKGRHFLVVLPRSVLTANVSAFDRFIAHSFSVVLYICLYHASTCLFRQFNLSSQLQ